jgi:hypothetical protein
MTDRKKTTRLIAVTTGLSLLLLGGCQANRKARPETVVKAADNTVAEVKTMKHAEKTADEIDFPIKQEVRQSYKLAPGATVSITGINGLLEVETSDTDTAEIYIVCSVRQQNDFNDRDLLIETQSDKLRIVRSTRNQDDFNDRKLPIEQPNDKLRIRVQQQRQRSFWSMLTPRSDERQRAYLKLPRHVHFYTNGVNGAIRVGEIGGRVEIHGSNGEIKVALATGGAEVAGVNGNVEVTLAQLTKGVQVHGVNGNIDLRFTGKVNADVEVRGVNGEVNPNLPNVTVVDKKRGRLDARIGDGGAPIEVRGVNGNINLLPALAAQTAKPDHGTAKVATK